MDRGDNKAPANPVGTADASSGQNVDVLIPCNACCCEIDSCILSWPECCGCTSTAICCCYEVDTKCCVLTNRKDAILNCQSTSCMCIYPTTCCKGINRYFCCDQRFACPCDKDVPCVVNFCFITCCFNYACKVGIFQSIGQLKGNAGVAAGK